MNVSYVKNKSIIIYNMPQNINDDNKSKFNSEAAIVNNIIKRVSDNNTNIHTFHIIGKYNDVRKKANWKLFLIRLNINSIC